MGEVVLFDSARHRDGAGLDELQDAKGFEHGDEAFDLVLSVLGHVGLFRLEVLGEITAWRKPAPRHLVVVADEYDVGAELWSATSYKKLREEAMSVDRWNSLHPGEGPRVPFVTRQLEGTLGPVIAVGYSMGGAIAQLTAQRHPDQVAGLVLCATSRSFRGAGRARARIAVQMQPAVLPAE